MSRTMSEERAEYKVAGELPAATLLPYGDPGYREPTPEDIRLALHLGGLTGSQTGALLGVDGRTVRRWTGGERDMPYSAWRLLLIEIGLAAATKSSNVEAAE